MFKESLTTQFRRLKTFIQGFFLDTQQVSETDQNKQPRQLITFEHASE